MPLQISSDQYWQLHRLLSARMLHRYPKIDLDVLHDIIIDVFLSQDTTNSALLTTICYRKIIDHLRSHGSTDRFGRDRVREISFSSLFPTRQYRLALGDNHRGGIDTLIFGTDFYQFAETDHQTQAWLASIDLPALVQRLTPIEQYIIFEVYVNNRAPHSLVEVASSGVTRQRIVLSIIEKLRAMLFGKRQLPPATKELQASYVIAKKKKTRKAKRVKEQRENRAAAGLKQKRECDRIHRHQSGSLAPVPATGLPADYRCRPKVFPQFGKDGRRYMRRSKSLPANIDLSCPHVG